MIQTFLRLFIPDTDNLSLKNKLFTVVKCFGVIFVVVFISSNVVSHLTYPILVASMGASVLIMLTAPSSSLAQPWSFIGGQMISGFVGISCLKTIPYIPLSAAVAVAMSALLMLSLRCLHPPGAATALAPVLSGQNPLALNYDFVLAPVGINALVITVMVLVINRWIMGYDYPAMTKSQKNIKPVVSQNPARLIGVSEQDILHSLKEGDTFVPVMTNELSKLLTEAEFYRFKRITGAISCADIMVTDFVWVEYDTEVEDAWQLMLKYQVKALPVIDRTRRVIGIVTWHDFFKFVDLQAYQSLPQRLQAFIRRTPDTTTNKPEAVGHLMTSKVTTLAADSHIVALIPLMADNGYRQIPIVDKERRLVGMVYQADLIAALYNQQLANER
jgi:CBS domain-containing membrane protein